MEIAGVEAVRLGAAARKVFDETGGTIGRLESSTWAFPLPS